jgi:hypothetical protein
MDVVYSLYVVLYYAIYLKASIYHHNYYYH